MKAKLWFLLTTLAFLIAVTGSIGIAEVKAKTTGLITENSNDSLKEHYAQKFEVYTNNEVTGVGENYIDTKVDTYNVRTVLYNTDYLKQFKNQDKVNIWGTLYENQQSKVYRGTVVKYDPISKVTNLSYRMNLFVNGHQTKVNPDSLLEVKNKQISLKETDFRIRKYLLEKEHLYSNYNSGELIIEMKNGARHKIDLGDILSDSQEKTFDFDNISHIDIYMK